MAIRANHPGILDFSPTTRANRNLLDRLRRASSSGTLIFFFDGVRWA
jgi:hypothetical protein